MATISQIPVCTEEVRGLVHKNPSASIDKIAEAGEEVTIAILARFTEAVRLHGAVPVILFFPMRIAELQGDQSGVAHRVRAHLKRVVSEELKAETLDLAKALTIASGGEEARVAAFFAHEDGTGHYSLEGNEVVAHAILAHLVAAGHIPATTRTDAEFP